MEIELTIQPDGSFLIPRGDYQKNAAFIRLFDGVVNIDDLENFFAMAEESEQILGENLCG